jgi:hypothetical protein
MVDGFAVTAEGRRSMMKLSQRMVSSFCASMTASQHHQWTHMPGPAGNDVCVRVSMHRNGDPGQPNGVVLSAATSVWLPVASDHVFAFVRDESTRSQVPSLASLLSLLLCVYIVTYVLTPLMPCVYVIAIAAHTVGRPDARQSGPGGVAHPQRRQPRELHLLAASE